MLTKDWEVVFGRIDEQSPLTPHQLNEKLSQLSIKYEAVCKELEISKNARGYHIYVYTYLFIYIYIIYIYIYIIIRVRGCAILFIARRA